MKIKEKNLCTICARGGSKGVKDKNIKKINGVSLLERSINQAKKAKIFDKIVLSTDSKKIINLSKSLGVDYTFLRSTKLSNDKVSKIDVIKDSLNKSEKNFGYRFDNIIDIDLTTPLRQIKDIKNAFYNFKNNNYYNLISVCEAKKNPYFNIIEIKNNNTKLVKNIKHYTTRQSSPKVFDVNSAIYIWKRDFLIKSNKIVYPKTGIYIMPRERSIDIDDNFDLYLVKKLIGE